jgi:hypothetical protein
LVKRNNNAVFSLAALPFPENPVENLNLVREYLARKKRESQLLQSYPNLQHSDRAIQLQILALDDQEGAVEHCIKFPLSYHDFPEELKSLFNIIIF